MENSSTTSWGYAGTGLNSLLSVVLRGKNPWELLVRVTIPSFPKMIRLLLEGVTPAIFCCSPLGEYELYRRDGPLNLASVETNEDRVTMVDWCGCCALTTTEDGDSYFKVCPSCYLTGGVGCI